VIEDGIRENPETEELLGVYGMALAENGRFSEAISALNKVIAMHPANHNVYYNLASVYAKTGDARLACLYLKEAMQKGFSDIELLKGDGRFERVKNSPDFAACLIQLQ
jgi:Flp pilus assembly protein TadD